MILERNGKRNELFHVTVFSLMLYLHKRIKFAFKNRYCKITGWRNIFGTEFSPLK